MHCANPNLTASWDTAGSFRHSMHMLICSPCHSSHAAAWPGQVLCWPGPLLARSLPVNEGVCLKLAVAALRVILAPRSRGKAVDRARPAGLGDAGCLKDPKMLLPLKECDLNSPGELLRVGLPAAGLASVVCNRPKQDKGSWSSFE